MKTFSSSLTFIYKYLFPTVWISGFAFGTLLLWLDKFNDKSGNGPPSEIKWVFLTVLLVASTFILKYCAALKRVGKDYTYLRVSNYFREIAIPFDQIAKVTENVWLNIHPVTIEFKNETEFGYRITFMPKVRIFTLWSTHPVVEELKLLARQ